MGLFNFYFVVQHLIDGINSYFQRKAFWWTCFSLKTYHEKHLRAIKIVKTSKTKQQFWNKGKKQTAKIKPKFYNLDETVHMLYHVTLARQCFSDWRSWKNLA